jgi:hypothetical protein
MLAKATGWSEEFIRHELPLSRGYAYIHAARLMDGECLMFYDQTAREDDQWIGEAKKRQDERAKRFDNGVIYRE